MSRGELATVKVLLADGNVDINEKGGTFETTPLIETQRASAVPHVGDNVARFDALDVCVAK